MEDVCCMPYKIPYVQNLPKTPCLRLPEHMATIFIDDSDPAITYIGQWDTAGSAAEYNEFV